MDCKSCKTKADVPYIAYESAMARNERTVKRLVAVIIVMAVILCATVGGFLWYLSQYDFAGEDVTVDASNGHANYIGQNGEIDNGTYYGETADTYFEESLTGEGTGSP